MVFWFASSQELAARLQAGFQYGNNTDLCGAGLPALRPCTPADLIDPDRPQPFSAGIAPQVTAPGGGGGHGRAPSTKALAAVVVVAVALLAATAAGLLALSWRRCRTQRVAGGSPPTAAGGPEAAAAKASSAPKSASSALASLEYSKAWDPLADARGGGAAAWLGFSARPRRPRETAGRDAPKRTCARHPSAAAASRGSHAPAGAPSPHAQASAMAVERRRKVVLQQDPTISFFYVYPFMCVFGPFVKNPLERIHLYT